jgi:hypothetical protein
MTRNEAADLNDVMVPTEQVHPDHREHAKKSKHVDESDLEARTQHERDLVDSPRTDHEA